MDGFEFLAADGEKAIWNEKVMVNALFPTYRLEPSIDINWTNILDGLSLANVDVRVVSVQEARLPLAEEKPCYLLTKSCLIRGNVIHTSKLGSIEVCRVGHLDASDGTVQLVEPAQHAVVKVFDIETTTTSQENPMQELLIHQKLSCFNNKHIMPLLGCLVSSKKAFAVYPYFSEGDLFLNLSKTDSLLAESRIKALLFQMVSAVKCCHDAGICHRDVSLENFLVTSDRNSVVLIDFGLSTEMKEQSFSVENHGPIGKVKYMAPELIMSKAPQYVDGRKLDIWSLGVTLFMLITKTEPFRMSLKVDERFNTIVLKKGMNRTFQSLGVSVSPSLIDLLEQMLNLEPPHRPTADDILSHAWLN